MTKAVRPLIEAGYLVEDVGEETRPSLGRPANPVRVDGGRALFIGVKITGDEIIAVLTDLCCRIRVARHLPLTARDPGGADPGVRAGARMLAEADGFGAPVHGLGVAVSGDVDRAAGVVRYSPFWSGTTSRSRRTPRDDDGPEGSTVDNDVRALTVAEQWFGAAWGFRTSRW